MCYVPEHNGTQHKYKQSNNQHNNAEYHLSFGCVIILSVTFSYCYAECCYVRCCFGESCGDEKSAMGYERSRNSDDSVAGSWNFKVAHFFPANLSR
jgi:hypothetical protein